MTDRDLLAGAIAGRLRLLPDVARLYPPRPALLQPIRTLDALLREAADQPGVVVSGDDPLVVEVDVGLQGSRSAVESGRAALAEVLAALPAATACRATVRLAAVD